MINTSKENILTLIEDIKNIRNAHCVENIYNERVYVIYLNPINDIEISVINCGLKYKIEIKKEREIFRSGEILYSSNFNPIISFKIKQIVKQYERNKRNERLKEILNSK